MLDGLVAVPEDHRYPLDGPAAGRPQKVWKATHVDLMAPVCDFLRRQEDQGPDCRDPAFPPGPRLLIKALLDDMDGATASGRAPLTRKASG